MNSYPANKIVLIDPSARHWSFSLIFCLYDDDSSAVEASHGMELGTGMFHRAHDTNHMFTCHASIMFRSIYVRTSVVCATALRIGWFILCSFWTEIQANSLRLKLLRQFIWMCEPTSCSRWARQRHPHMKRARRKENRTVSCGAYVRTIAV